MLTTKKLLISAAAAALLAAPATLARLGPGRTARRCENPGETECRGKIVQFPEGDIF